MNKILVVDDEKLICISIKRELEDLGYKVQIALNGADAIDCVENNEIEMAFVDLILPDINGMNVCKRIKQLNSNIKVVLMSGYTDKLMDLKKEFSLLKGAKDMLEKPFGGDDILKQVTSFFVS
ncbi:MAG: response regulator [Candidatus Omnitrophica bacterium]|nr:response regulator [Candidatus Omnitrophota bacterium]